MKVIVLIFFLSLVALSIAAVLLMLASVFNRVFKRKSKAWRRAKISENSQTRLFPSRLVAEYYGGMRTTKDNKLREQFEKGLSYSVKGKYERAIKIFQRCLYGNLTSAQRAGVLLTLGNCCFTLDKLKSAQEYYQKADHLTRESNHPNGILASTINLGLVSAANKNWNEAIGIYHQVIDLDRKMDYPGGEAIDLNTLGLLYEICGDSENALNRYEESLVIFEKLKDHKKAELVENNIRRLKNLNAMTGKIASN